jgi:PBP1b-binding outer membrane lipoprotein LpoB
MKKSLAVVFSEALLLGGLVGCSSATDAPKPATSEPAPVGAYTDERPVTAEDLEVFETAMKDVTNVENYKPTKVATQVVAGTNYRFTVTVTEGDAKREAHVFIFKPLDGDPTFVSEEDV